MSLESLDGQPNIHDLTTEQENHEITSKDFFQGLKETQHFNKETGFWNVAVKENGESFPDKCSLPNLLSVLVEMKFDPEKALKRYEWLKSTELFDNDKKQWVETVGSETTLYEGSEKNLQMADFLIKMQLNPNKTEKGYREFYEETLEENPALETKRSEFNLWNIILTSYFNPQRARNLLTLLKESGFYDKKQNFYKIEPKTSHVGCFIDTHDQFLGVIAEARFDKNKALEEYERLKNTDLYKPEKDEWYYHATVFNQGMLCDGDLGYQTSDKMLELLCIQEFESPRNYSEEKQTPDLPQQRRY